MGLRKGKKNDLPPPPAGLPMPPPPGDLPPPPAPVMAAPAPPSEPMGLPTPPPLPTEPAMPSPLAGEPATLPLPPAPAPPEPAAIVEEEIEVVVEVEDEPENYSELWKNRTEKSLQQMYGHIDRLGNSDVGSLLDRYADRFGHELDREIIVMRKSDKQAERDLTPTVELISTSVEADEEGDDDSLIPEISERLSDLESEMRPIKKSFDAARAKKKQAAITKYGNMLKPMVAERKLLKAILSGEADISELEEFDEEVDEEDDSDGDNFAEFFGVVNTLLGDMPEDFISNFIDSKNFKLFEKVGEDPEGCSDTLRTKFFKMVNQELGTIPDDKLSEFMETAGFQLFIEMSEIYGE